MENFQGQKRPGLTEMEKKNGKKTGPPLDLSFLQKYAKYFGWQTQLKREYAQYRRINGK
jgi:hypothetical protein